MQDWLKVIGGFLILCFPIILILMTWDIVDYRVLITDACLIGLVLFMLASMEKEPRP